MKKVLSSLVSVALLAAPAMALAQAEEAPELDIMEVLDSITDWLFTILIVIAAIWIIIAAYTFVTAAGDPDKTKKARDFVMYAMIGVIVAFAAKGLVVLVSRMVGYEIGFF